MKYVLCLIFMFMCSVSYANVYIVYDEQTKQVCDISSGLECAGAMVDGVFKNIKDLKVVTMDGNVKDLGLEYDARNYTYKNGKLVANVKKMSDDSVAYDNMLAKDAEMKLIENKVKLMAKKDLEAEGVTFEKVKDKDFE